MERILITGSASPSSLQHPNGGSDAVLEARGLYKSYGSHVAVAGVDVHINAGQILALLGPNGAGKTTLVSLVAGLVRPDGGRVSIAGIDALRNPRHAQAYIGLVPQDLGIYPTLTAHQNLLLFAELAGIPRRQVSSAIDQTASALAISDLLGRRAGTLSGGEKRRLHTAIGLMKRPRLLLLDEPTVGADVASRQQLISLVRDISSNGTAICYTTHYLAEVEELPATIAILERGRVIESGTREDLTRRHGTTVVELQFQGDAPALGMKGEELRGQVLRIPTSHPHATIMDAIKSLEGGGPRLQSLEIVRPSLENVYMSLTGRRSATDRVGPSKPGRNGST